MATKKRIKPGKLEPGADGCSILVHFTTEISHLDDEGNAVEVERVPGSKEIPIGKPLRGLPAEELAGLAQDIVDDCRYIPAHKLQQVEHVLSKMHGRQNGKLLGDGDRRRHSNGFQRQGQDEHWAPAASTNGSSASPSWRVADFLPPAEARRVDDYTEALYEERMEAKAAGARKILRLCTDTQLLYQVAEHTTLLGVLSRELRESAKRSHELAVAITGIFLCLARFAQFHGALTASQCGEATLRVLEYESKRRTMLRKELKLHQGEMVARGSAATAEQRQKLEREEEQYRSVLERQDGLLLLCVLVLRSLADDVAVERKLAANKICHLLGPLLSRHSEDILLAALGFLHKLSIFEQNKDQLVQSHDVMTRLADLSGHPSVEVALIALRLCYNLSFDARARVAFLTQTALLGKVLAACQQAAHKKIAFKLLYMLSMETAHRSCIAKQGPGCVALAVLLCSKSRDGNVDPESAALCLNLAADEACASILVKSDGFAKLMLRGIQHADPLLLKVLRHAAGHEAVRPRLLSSMASRDAGGHEWLHRLLQLAASAADQPAALVEALGVFSALDRTSDVVPWPELCDAGLLELLQRLLTPGFAEDDVALECVMIVGTLAASPECGERLAASQLPHLIAELLPDKEGDSDLTMQLLHSIRCMLVAPDLRGVIVWETDGPGHIVQMLREGLEEEPERGTAAAERAAEAILDLVVAAERGGLNEVRWTDEIKAYRFERHNLEWCRRLGGEDSGPSGGVSPEPPRGAAADRADASALADRCLGSTNARGFGVANGHKHRSHR